MKMIKEVRTMHMAYALTKLPLLLDSWAIPTITVRLSQQGTNLKLRRHYLKEVDKTTKIR